jgi:hypothetical protein
MDVLGANRFRRVVCLKLSCGLSPLRRTAGLIPVPFAILKTLTDTDAPLDKKLQTRIANAPTAPFV